METEGIPILQAACCIGCTQCRLICPAGAIDQVGARCRINAARCIRCGKCLGICPLDCISAARPKRCCPACGTF